MSRKNNLATRQRLHTFSLQRERADQARKQQKAAKKEQKTRVQSAGVVKKPLKKTKPKAIRIRKGLTVKGIKIVDAESKKLAKERVAAEALNKMDLDEWEEVPEGEQA